MAVKADIIIDQGSTYSTNLNLTDSSNNPVNLTGYVGRSQFRPSYDSNTAYSFTVSIPNPNTGVVILSLSANDSSNVAFGKYLYDVELVDSGGNVTRIVEGILTLTPEVTKL